MSTTSLAELKERVAKATGPDRELDGLIEQALGILPSDAYWSTSNVYGDVVAHWISGGYGAYKYHEPEALTASLDAAIALVEMKLPGWGWCCEKTCAGLCRAVVWHPLAKCTIGGPTHTPPPSRLSQPCLKHLKPAKP